MVHLHYTFSQRHELRSVALKHSIMLTLRCLNRKFVTIIKAVATTSSRFQSSTSVLSSIGWKVIWTHHADTRAPLDTHNLL